MSMFHELMMRKKEEIMYATIKGTLTENNGVFSGFSATSYLTLQQQVSVGQDTKLDIVVKIKSSQLNESSAFLGTMDSIGLEFRISGAGKITFYLGNGSNWIVSGLAGTTTLSANTDYYARVKIDNGVITTYISTDGTTWTQEATTTVTFSQTYNYEISLGTGRLPTTYFVGTIDLTNSYIKLGSTKYNLQAVVGYTVVGSPTITDGVVSGFSNDNYIITPTLNFSTLDNFELNFKFLMENRAIACYLVDYNFLTMYIGEGSRAIYMMINDSNTKHVGYQVNSYINIKIRYSNSKFSYYANDVLFATLENVTPNSFNRGLRLCKSDFEGKLIIKDCYIKANNKLWFNGQQA